MTSISTVRKLTMLARTAVQYAERSRTFGAILKGVRAAVNHWGRVLHQLWLEVTGFVFLALAGIGVLAFVREYAKYHAGTATSTRVIIAIVFTLMFGWFGLSSFWQVRRK